MGKKVRSFKDGDGYRGFHFHCPGCDNNHTLYIEGNGPKWTFNGNEEKPTFSPSVLTKGYLGDEHGDRKNNGVCHSFITDGEIRFLGDCTHDLKGHTVELPDF